MGYHDLVAADLVYIYLSDSWKLLAPQEREHKDLTVFSGYR